VGGPPWSRVGTPGQLDNWAAARDRAPMLTGIRVKLKLSILFAEVTEESCDVDQLLKKA